MHDPALDRPLPPPPFEGSASPSWRCDFIEADGPCPHRAVAHYQWVQGGTSGACLIHVAAIEAEYSYADRHVMRMPCTQPDALWCNSLEDPPGRCEVPPLADILEASGGAELVGTVHA